MLVKRLKQSELRSISQLPEHQEQDIIEEFCYTESPLQILEKHCSEETLYKIADSFSIETKDPIPTKEKLAETIAQAIGFLPGNQNIQGLESARKKLEELQIAFENSGTLAKQRGHLHEAIDQIERAVDLVGGFYSKMLHLTGWEAFLRRHFRDLSPMKGKPKFSLGQKIGALRELSRRPPDFPLDERVERGFKFPLLSRDVFDKLDWICTQRNKLAHSGVEFDNRQALRNFGRDVFEHTVETSRMLVNNPSAPRFVQITSSKEDEYGRHFYEGRDEKNREEKIFTPIGLGVGEVYAFFPLTNPVRIDPLIFPLD